MKYTLDSVKLQVAALSKKYKKEFIFEEYFTYNLPDLIFPQENLFYYGVLTHGASTFNCEIYFKGNLSITIVENSQIEMLFTDLFITKDGLAQDKMSGQFIGFKIFEK
jgi:hypothetical protein